MLLFIIFCFIAYCVGGELWGICRYGLILGFVWAVVSEIIKKRPAAKARKESRKADREARRARRELEAARKELAAAVASVASAPSADDDEDEESAPSAPRMGLIARWKDEQRRMDEEAFCALDDDEETEDEEAETMEKNVFIEQIEDPKIRARAYEILAETDLFPGETFEPLPDDADEDEAFHGIDREKEAKRLRRVLEGLYNKRDKLEYMGVSKNTQRWRGLEYDIAAAERRLAFFEG